jgi:hypothetical protein
MKMNVQEKLAAIEQHAAKSLIEIRELMVYLSGHPAAVVSFDDVPAHTPNRIVNLRKRGGPTHGGGWVSPLDESVEWPDDAA